MGLIKGIFTTAFLTFLLKFAAPVYAEEKNKIFDEQGENPYVRNYEEDFDVQAAFQTFTSTRDYHGIGAVVRALAKFDDNRIALDLGGAFSHDRDLDAIAGKVEAYFGHYFKTDDVTFYAQGGLGFTVSQLDENKMTLDETLFSPKIKLGAYNQDFIADFTVKIGLGNYSLDSEVLKRSDSSTEVDIKTNFRAILDGDFDLEAGLHFVSKNFDNLWDYFVTEFGIGAVYQPKDSKFAIQFAPYLRYSQMDSGIEQDFLEGGVQCKGYFKISKNFMFLAAAGYDTEDGLQLYLACKFNNSNLEKKEE